MRIVFVGTPASIHAARWIRQLQGTGWDLHFFDSAGAPNICPELDGVTLYCGWYAPAPAGLEVHYRWPFRRGNIIIPKRAPGLARLIVPDRAKDLANLIRKLQPDCIHALSMTHSVYVLQDAFSRLGNSRIPWIYTSWGSDLYYFGQQPEHRPRMLKIMPTIKYYISNTRRDVTLAEAFGFRGEVMGIFPGPGGYPLDEMLALRHSEPPSARRIIAIKGFENFAGRALAAFDALEKCLDVLEGYKVVVYSPHPPVVKRVEELSKQTDIPFEMIRSRHNPQPVIWELFGQSRVHIGISASDGIPNAMLEAMVMGAFPIQTNPGGVTEEWVQDGVNGLLVPHDDPDAIAVALRKAVKDDALVDHAAELNAQATRERLDIEKVRPRVIDIYRYVVNKGP